MVKYVLLAMLIGGCSNLQSAKTVSDSRYDSARQLQLCERAALRSTPEPQEEDDTGIIERDEKRQNSIRECLKYNNQ